MIFFALVSTPYDFDDGDEAHDICYEHSQLLISADSEEEALKKIPPCFENMRKNEEPDLLSRHGEHFRISVSIREFPELEKGVVDVSSLGSEDLSKFHKHLWGYNDKDKSYSWLS